MDDECLLCDPDRADVYFPRRRVWESDLWWLSVVEGGPVAGFAHLEPHRHIPYLTDLDGREASTLGEVLARVTRALRDATGSEKVYVYVFGDHTPHLHFNLAPHRAGDALRGGPGLLDPSHPDLDASLHDETAEKVRRALAGAAGSA